MVLLTGFMFDLMKIRNLKMQLDSFSDLNF